MSAWTGCEMLSSSETINKILEAKQNNAVHDIHTNYNLILKTFCLHFVANPAKVCTAPDLNIMRNLQPVLQPIVELSQ